MEEADSGTPCRRCKVRPLLPGESLCGVCTPMDGEKPPRWHLTVLASWLPTALMWAAFAWLLTVIVGGAAVYLAARTARPPLDLPLLAAVRLAAQLHWMGLGCPAHLTVDVQGIGFAGHVRFASFATLAASSVFLMLGGALLARSLHAANEREHLVCGLLSPLPMAFIALCAAPLSHVSCTLTRPDGPFAALTLNVGFPHAFFATLWWTAVWSTVGALGRYVWRTRGKAGRFEAFAHGVWPAACGAFIAVLLGLVVATVGSFGQLRTLGHYTVQAAPSSELGMHTPWALWLATASDPLDLDSRSSVDGTLVSSSEETYRVRLSRVEARTQESRLSATPPFAAAPLIGLPLLGAACGGAFAIVLAGGRRRVSIVFLLGLMYVLLRVALAIWLGGWFAGRIGIEHVGASDFWVAWRADLLSVAWLSAAIGWGGAALGALLVGPTRADFIAFKNTVK